MFKITINISYYFVILNLLTKSITFNIDVKYPIFFKGSANDYFGFSVGLLRNSAGEHALITAPRANSTIWRGIYQPGVLRKCKISFTSHSQSCDEVLLDRFGNSKDTSRPNFAYVERKEDMYLGISLDIQQNMQNNKIVVCGHLWKNQYYDNHYLANGICYVINSELEYESVKKLLPLIDKTRQSIKDKRVYLHAYGQAGMSAVFSEDGKHLFLGTPGFNDWTGTVLIYRNPRGNENFADPIINGIERPVYPETYIGYSLSTGKFFKTSETFIAAGGPRDTVNLGQVYILNTEPFNNMLRVHMKIEGKQFGEYFGAAVLGIDLNMDRLTDLLVGAPFHSTSSGGDEGKVYVYISDGNNLKHFAEINGKNTPNARFGTCISNIGDINQDGYNDVAIGAPYENRGAVYIYHGTQSGINHEYSQRILASEISPALSGFGISISRGLDVDENNYADILIGAYESSHAVLFRSHPVIKLTGRLEFFPHQINANVTSCERNGENATCFQVTTCLHYTGEHNRLKLTFETELYADYSKQNSRPRSYFISEGQKVRVIKQTMEVSIGTDECLNNTAYLKNYTKDIITPMDFSFVYRLEENKEKGFCKTCPVIDPTIYTNNITKAISFQTGCESENECFSNLIVQASLIENPENVPLIIGNDTTKTLNIDIINKGEPAYLSELLIFLPPEIYNINQDFCYEIPEQQKQEINSTLLCNLGNPLEKDKKVNIKIKLDFSKVPTKTEALSIILKAGTKSTETDPLDNDVEFIVNFKSSADIHITGNYEHEVIQYDDVKRPLITIKHTYFIVNHGPSPIDTVDMEFRIPTKLKKGDDLVEFVILNPLESESSDALIIPAMCDGPKIELKPIAPDISKSSDEFFDGNDLIAQNSSVQVVRRSVENENINLNSSEFEMYSQSTNDIKEASAIKRKNYIMNCETADCMVIHCNASPFINIRKFAKLTITMFVNVSIMEEVLDPWYQIEFITRGKVTIRNSTIDLQPKNNYPDETLIKTTLVHPGPLPPEEIALWIIYVSIGIGVFLLIIILIVLIKIGFFKRQQKEKMHKMMTNANLKEWEPYLLNNDSDVNATEPTNDTGT